MKAAWFLTALALVCVFATIVRAVILVRYMMAHPESRTMGPVWLHGATARERFMPSAIKAQAVSFLTLLLFGFLIAVALFLRWLLH